MITNIIQYVDYYCRDHHLILPRHQAVQAATATNTKDDNIIIILPNLLLHLKNKNIIAVYVVIVLILFYQRLMKMKVLKIMKITNMKAMNMNTSIMMIK